MTRIPAGVSDASAGPEISRPRTSERTWVLTVSGTHALIHAIELTFAALLPLRRVVRSRGVSGVDGAPARCLPLPGR